VVVYPEGIYYLKVQLGDVQEIVEETRLKNEQVERLLYTDPVTKEDLGEHPANRRQRCGLVQFGRAEGSNSKGTKIFSLVGKEKTEIDFQSFGFCIIFCFHDFYGKFLNSLFYSIIAIIDKIKNRGRRNGKRERI